IASEVGGTDLSTNLSMLGGLMGVVDLVSYDALRDSIQERFGGAKFIASGTTSALDDVLKSKYAQVAQLVEKNMEVIRAASTAVTEYDLNTKQEAEWTGGAATYVSAEVDLEKCNGCKICILTCPDPNVIEYVQDSKKVGINAYRCKGCGLCVTACPREALSISSV
ncbi:MAG TPA: 4Fe-4S binding protein, partial [Magnetospirillaceae bacterium]|nr:4Fe-4S binding protein [Magnetospirillaceae bacterium]